MVIVNPSMLYLCTTALTEPVLIASMALSLAGLSNYATRRRLSSPGEVAIFCGLPAALAALSRYEGWALCLTGAVFVAVVTWVRGGRRWRRSLGAVVAFLCPPAAAIGWWVGYNWVVFHNPLEFFSGQFSANAQQAQIVAEGASSKSSIGSTLRTLDLAVSSSVGPASIALAGVGLVVILIARGRWRRLLFLVAAASSYLFLVVALYTGQAIIWNPGVRSGYAWNNRFGMASVLPVALLASAATQGAVQLAGRLPARRSESPAFARAARAAVGLVVALALAGQAGWFMQRPFQRSLVLTEAAVSWRNSTPPARGGPLAGQPLRRRAHPDGRDRQRQCATAADRPAAAAVLPAGRGRPVPAGAQGSGGSRSVGVGEPYRAGRRAAGRQHLVLPSRLPAGLREPGDQHLSEAGRMSAPSVPADGGDRPLERVMSPTTGSAAMVHWAAEHFAEEHPAFSAKQGLRRWQAALPALGLLLVVVGAVLNWRILIAVVFGLGNVALLVSSGFKVGASLLLPIHRFQLRRIASGERDRRDAALASDRAGAVTAGQDENGQARQDEERVCDADLPVYSILVPVFHEATVVSSIMASFEHLDYPREKLDVLILMEADDVETIAAARAAEPPGWMRLVTVPAGEPRTKPRACNYGLLLCRGEYVVIYDAEDRPEPDQLRRALASFRHDAGRRQGRLGCVQASLNFYNPDYTTC